MADVFPNHKFNPDQTPWARAVQDKLAAHDAQNTLNAQSTQNINQGMSATLGTLGKQIQAVEALEAGLQTQINTLIGNTVNTQTLNATTAVNTGNLNLTGSSTIAGSESVTGNVTVGGGLNVGGIIRSPATYSNSITSSFRNVFVTSVDGSLGFNLSSRRFKQNIEDLIEDPALILKLRLVTFKYIAAVEQVGDDADTEIGLIAEEVDALGLSWLVDYENGKPLTLKFHLLSMAVLLVAQNQEGRIAALEAKQSALELAA